MPLIRFEVKNEYGLGDPELYRAAAKREDSKPLLDGVAVAGLVGILRQLGDLAEFAADVFHDLQEQVTATSARGRDMLTRIQNLEAALPSVEKAVQGQTTHIHFAYVAGSDWHTNVRTEHNHLLGSELPRFMMDSYEECRDPPRLYLLDKFDSAGAGACLKRYSDPSYFKRVWATSKVAKAEKYQREKKAQKNKRKGLQTRSGESQKAGTISRHNSSLASSMRFASPSTDGQSIPSDNTFRSFMRQKPDTASCSASCDSKSRLSCAEQASDTYPAVVSDHVEYDNSSSSKLQNDHNDACAAGPHDEQNDGADESPQNSMQEQLDNRSSSVSWDEKTEIVNPTSSNSCDDILFDKIQDSEPLPSSSEQLHLEQENSQLVDRVQHSDSGPARFEPSNMDHEITKLGPVDQEAILFGIANVPVSSSGGNHFDEITSETDNYTDALNTMESETETDSECQTKREVNSLLNHDCRGIDQGNVVMPEIIAASSDLSGVAPPVASDNFLNKDLSSKSAPLPCKSDFGLNHKNSKDFPENHLDARTDNSEGDNGSLSGLRMHQSQNMPGDETADNKYQSHGIPTGGTSVEPSSKFWTNGNLFGVEPSKPPDFGFPNVNRENSTPDVNSKGVDLSHQVAMSNLLSAESSADSDKILAPSGSLPKSRCSVESMDLSLSVCSSMNQSNLSSYQLLGIALDMVRPSNPSKYNPSGCNKQHDDVSGKRNAEDAVQADSSNGPNKSPELQSNNFYAPTDKADRTDTSAFTRAAESSSTQSIDSQSNGSGRPDVSISSSFSSLAQKFLANSLQRKSLVTHADISQSMVNSNNEGSHEKSLKHKDGPSGVVSQTISEERIREKVEQRPSINSTSSTSHYSGHSSPPLEHMKISFLPMNGLETSKLKLEFSNGNIREGDEEFMFPSFQLLPQASLPLPDSASESDDDTFCRSCPYSSEDLLSPRSDLNSEVWEPVEENVGKDKGTFNGPDGLSSSAASISNSRGFEHMTNHRGDAASVFMNLEDDENTGVSLHPGHATDLPCLNSLELQSSHSVLHPAKFQNGRLEGNVDSSSTNYTDRGFQVPNELPLRPPLPPSQWRMMKTSCASVEVNESGIPEVVDHLHGLRNEECTSNPQQEQNTQSQHVTEAFAPPNMAQDQQKVNAQKAPVQIVNKGPVEREDLLQQIRNKAFSLRRTVVTKQSLATQSTTNVKVAAILEKADAIRQAFVSSDEGAENNWSDC